MIEKPKYFNQTMFDKEDFRIGITVVNRKKLIDGREIDLVFNSKDSVAASNGVYLVLSFKKTDEYINAYCNYIVIRDLKKIFKRINENGFGQDPEVSVEFSTEFLHLQFEGLEDDIKISLYSNDRTLLAETLLSTDEFEIMQEILDQVSLPTLQAIYSMAFISTDKDNTIDLHISPRRQKDKIQRRGK